jgi:hypothetical protein
MNTPNVSPETIDELGTTITNFMVDLALEGDRSAVVLGAARLDLALENLLSKVLMPSSDKVDNLFGSDRPLRSFSAKIALASRLGLIDNDFNHALQMVRKLRNDFAHSPVKENLSKPEHKSRVNELYKDAEKFRDTTSVKQMFEKSGEISPVLLDFTVALWSLLTDIEITSLLSSQMEIPHSAMSNWRS